MVPVEAFVGVAREEVPVVEPGGLVEALRDALELHPEFAVMLADSGRSYDYQERGWGHRGGAHPLD